MIAPMSIAHVDRVLVLLRSAMLVALLMANGPLVPPGVAGAPDQNATALVRDLAARSASWLTPPGSLETLEYSFISGSEVTRIRAKRGEPRRVAVWMGATLHAGFHELTRSPERFAVELK